METGVARQFRYRPDTGDFQVVANNALSGRSAGSVTGGSDTQTALKPAGCTAPVRR